MYKDEDKYVFLFNLLAYIKSLGYSQRQIADMIGVNEVTISRYFNGTRFPKYEIILKIYKAFNITSELIDSFKQGTQYEFREDNNINLSEMFCKISKLNKEHIIEINRCVDVFLRLEEYEKKDNYKKKVRK